MTEKENMISNKTLTEELMMFLFEVLNFTALLLPNQFKVFFYAWKFLLLDAFFRS